VLGSKLESVEEEDDEDLITDTAPPEFADSPRTPRSNPRYHLRPSPSPSPSQTRTHDDLSDVSANLAAAFRQAEEALLGPRLTRQQRKTPLPDDILHRFPWERKKKK
jgi:hypothetical protein